ncbi:SdiA-regulated domain-containing protein [Lutibacter sp. A80]|uniref:SdiA-regulated domain-containing protein n=1 Tax=Lutibacter sp. A80 TaxID=2918453 RepID=UPI001F0581D9|nr:SdiA-regulated domain-containing protein [Lutibacter sp. A80]UMB60436.1 SdiA-regulated domain-containing protein [Lutibacter sp. A80]
MKLSIPFIILNIFITCQKDSKATFDECEIYQLNKPAVIWKMPKVLNEISGIELLKNQKIVTHNDEDGNLFLYNLDSKNIEKTIPFAKDGDYEDIAVKGNTAYILRSNGSIFEIQNYLNAPNTIKHKTFLKHKDNTEGLFYDNIKNRLLIACKENSEGKNKRFVYEFLLNKNTLNPIPVLTISQKKIKKLYNIKSKFSPSGIAIHPISKNIYILSSVGKMLAEFSSKGNLLKIYSLNYSHFTQPEGIRFNKNGDLYISNEAKKNNANILKFKFIS